jgi:hypothetical protein
MASKGLHANGTNGVRTLGGKKKGKKVAVGEYTGNMLEEDKAELVARKQTELAEIAGKHDTLVRV